MAAGVMGFVAYRQVRKEFGYVGTEDEKRLHDEWVAGRPQSRRPTTWQRVKEAKEQKVQADMDSFEEAVGTLPDKASFSVEIDWIRSHPALVRLYRQSDKSKDVVLTAEDVLRCSCGPAPSKSAVYSLQHWANHVMEFHKQMLSEHKKRQEDQKADESVERDMGMDEVRKLLEEL